MECPECKKQRASTNQNRESHELLSRVASFTNDRHTYVYREIREGLEGRVYT